MKIATGTYMEFKKLFLLSLLFVFSLGCEDKSSNSKMINESTKPIDLSELNLNSNNVRMLTLNSKQLGLLSEIENNEIRSKTIIDSLLITQKKIFLSFQVDPNILIPNESEILDLIRKYLSEIDFNQNLNTIKNLFEIQLIKDKVELQFNHDQPSIWSIILNQKIQSYSGTLLFEMIRRFRPESLFQKDNSVVIFTDSDVMSGYLKWDGKKSFRLKGIKLDGNNLSEIDFGYVDSLSGVRIVDSDIFLITEIFKNQITNPLIVFKNGLNLTAEKYNLPLEQMESTVTNPLLKLNYESFDSEAALTLGLRLKDPMTLSIFSFGN